MNITFSGHARQRMNERNVTIEDVENVLSDRGPGHPGAKKRTQRGRSLGGKRLEVVYTEKVAGYFHVVTVKVLSR